MKTIIKWFKSLIKEKWECCEIHRANMPQYGCTSQCKDCKKKQYNK